MEKLENELAQLQSEGEEKTKAIEDKMERCLKKLEDTILQVAEAKEALRYAIFKREQLLERACIEAEKIEAGAATSMMQKNLR